MKKFLWIIIALLIVAMIVGCGQQAAKGKKLNIAFVYVGPIGDAGWTYAHNDGRLAMEELDFVEKTVYVESVPEGAEAVRPITQLAEAGNDIIFTTSFGFMDPTLEVAEKYPDKVFMHCSGYKTSENMGAYFGRMYQAKYLGGIVAGSMSKSGKIGYVAPHPIPEVIRLISAFTLGAQSVNPNAVVHIVWTNSWFDPAKEMDAANSMIELGCDVITQGADSAGPQQAAEKHGVWSLGYDSDMAKFAPTVHLTAPVWHWSVFYNHVAEQVYKGTWKSADDWWGIETGLIGLSPYNDAVPQDVRDLVETTKQAIIDKEFHCFNGPVYDQEGTLKVNEGEHLTDEQMLSMDWFVKGVIGSIPKSGE